ncbi:UNVERIFIED_ORG: hypothetical protein ABIB19_000353 [Arthrobacter sp. UYEF10]
MAEVEHTPDLRPPLDAVFEPIGGSLPSEPEAGDGDCSPTEGQSGRWLLTQIAH